MPGCLRGLPESKLAALASAPRGEAAACLAAHGGASCSQLLFWWGGDARVTKLEAHSLAGARHPHIQHETLLPNLSGDRRRDALGLTGWQKVFFCSSRPIYYHDVLVINIRDRAEMSVT